MGRKSLKKDKPNLNPELLDFDIKINQFGEIVSTMDISILNKFLDENVDDKKLKGNVIRSKSEVSLEN